MPDESDHLIKPLVFSSSITSFSATESSSSLKTRPGDDGPYAMVSKDKVLASEYSDSQNSVSAKMNI